MQKLEYLRIDLMSMINRPKDRLWLDSQPDCEWRYDYQCWFILKGSRTHIMAELKFGPVFVI